MMQGKSNKAICRVLNLAEPTGEEIYVTAILKALKVNSRVEAVIAVGKHGWKFPPVPKAVESTVGRSGGLQVRGIRGKTRAAKPLRGTATGGRSSIPSFSTSD